MDGVPPRDLARSTQDRATRYELATAPAEVALPRELLDAGAPLYRRVPGGGLVVATGRVLVRFGAGEAVEAHRDEIADAGYEIETVLSYAPEAAWVLARSGAIGDALADIARVEALPGVVNVEPQMIGEVSRRDA